MRRICFLSWYRVLPLMLTFSLGGCAYLYSYAPAPLMRMVYPLYYESAIASASERYGVDPFLVCAVIDSESGWDENAQSHRGAVGLMQLMPDTATDMIAKGIVDGRVYSVDELTDPEVNIEFGTAYLGYLLSYFDGNVDRAVAAYNAGLANVDYWSSQGGALHSAITYPETQAYLVRVQNAQERYQELYGARF